MNKMTEPADFIGFNNNLFQRLRDMHRSWLERLREIRQIESEFGTRLLTAKRVHPKRQPSATSG